MHMKNWSLLQCMYIVSFVIYEESINEQYAIQFARPLFDK